MIDNISDFTGFEDLWAIKIVGDNELPFGILEI
jgi:hypothetical protein